MKATIVSLQDAAVTDAVFPMRDDAVRSTSIAGAGAFRTPRFSADIGGDCAKIAGWSRKMQKLSLVDGLGPDQRLLCEQTFAFHDNDIDRQPRSF
jgi:hypothetical protein